jgi:hypothetical protein
MSKWFKLRKEEEQQEEQEEEQQEEQVQEPVLQKPKVRRRAVAAARGGACLLLAGAGGTGQWQWLGARPGKGSAAAPRAAGRSRARQPRGSPGCQQLTRALLHPPGCRGE